MASRADPVKINAYALKASATIKVECGHHWGGWEQVGTFVANATSTVLWGDTMYPASVSVSLPADCWESAAEGFQTFLRFQQSTSDTIPAAEIPRARCVMTVIGGEIVFDESRR